MIRSSVRTTGLAILLTVNGCGVLNSSGSGTGAPGLTVAETALQGGSGLIALQVSDDVLRASPNNTHAMEIKADALSLLGNHDEAAAIFQALLAKDPNSIRANTGLGRIRLAKDPAGAERLFQQVLKRDPNDMTALNNVGIARDLQGRHAEAQTAYRQALAINPDLDSAQVNLALSMAMSGQGPAAIQLLRDKATRSGASAKVRHDYAVVLAMAGNRSEAEQVLSADLSPEEIRQVLDGVTGAHGKPRHSTVTIAAVPREDEVPPDVVQVPESPAKPEALSRTAASSSSIPPARIPAAPVRAATLVAPVPMVVRPQPVVASDSDTPAAPPVSPVAAAVINQRSLSLPLPRATTIQGAASGVAPVEPAQTMDTTPDSAISVPVVVAMPPARPAEQVTSTHDIAADVAMTDLPAAPPAPPVLRPLPLPPALQLPRTAAHAEVPAAVVTTASDHPLAKAAPLDSAPASPTVAPAQSAAAVTPAANPMAATPDPAPEAPPNEIPRAAFATEPKAVVAAAPVRAAHRNDTSLKVQFAAAASEETAHSFWQYLVHRFPDALNGREPIVIRFQHDGMVFWRVRTEGFDTMSDAQMLCARMRADGQDCFVPRS